MQELQYMEEEDGEPRDLYVASDHFGLASFCSGATSIFTYLLVFKPPFLIANLNIPDHGIHTTATFRHLSSSQAASQAHFDHINPSPHPTYPNQNSLHINLETKLTPLRSDQSSQCLPPHLHAAYVSSLAP